MKRLRRIIFNGLTVLSLLLCMATMALWTRSVTRSDLVGYGGGTRAWWLGSGGGRIGGTWATVEDGGGNFGEYMDEQGRPFNAPMKSEWLAGRWIIQIEDWADWLKARPQSKHCYARLIGRGGIVVGRARIVSFAFNIGPVMFFPSSRIDHPLAVTAVLIPCWMLVLVFSPLPTFRVLQWWRQFRKSRLGLCPSCGYDLRATPARCPECGTIAVKAKS